MEQRLERNNFRVIYETIAKVAAKIRRDFKDLTRNSNSVWSFRLFSLTRLLIANARTQHETQCKKQTRDLTARFFVDVDWVGRDQSASNAPFCQVACTERATVRWNVAASQAGPDFSVKRVSCPRFPLPRSRSSRVVATRAYSWYSQALSKHATIRATNKSIESFSFPPCSAICSQGCSREHGGCRRPGTCRCRVGWTGPNCTECVPYPGCVHGSCKRPWECRCEPGWAADLCNEKLTYCDEHPAICRNNATCVSMTKEDGDYR